MTCTLHNLSKENTPGQSAHDSQIILSHESKYDFVALSLFSSETGKTEKQEEILG